MPPNSQHPHTHPSDAHHYAAWWSCVIEPGDEAATHLRRALGEEDAQAWASNPTPCPLPEELSRDTGMTWEHWQAAHQRWHPRAQHAQVDEELGVLEGLGGHLIIPGDPQWPHALDDLGPLAPAALWVLGTLPQGASASIVGARASSQYGNRMSTDISAHLAYSGITIVSGGAFGIDIAAHRAALDVDGHTTAIMAGGVAQLYPQAHEADFRRITATGGAIISESPPTWRPARWRFLSRNRLIAALGQATIVIEAGVRSGALATARHAMTLGREVGAVPGMTTHELSKGCHDMIRNGATLIRHGNDAQELLNIPAIQEPLFGSPVAIDHGIDALPPAPRRVWEALSTKRAMSLDTLTRESGLSRRDVLAALAGLELNGKAQSTTRGWKRIEN